MHGNEQIAAAVASQMRHALFFDAKGSAVLGARRNRVRDLAFQRWNLNLIAERGLRKVNGQVEQEVGALALKNWMRLDTDDDIQIAGGTISQPGFAFAGKPNLRAIVDAGWNGDGEFARALDALVAFARRARRRNDFAGAFAPWAGCYIDKRSKNRLLDAPHFAGTLALRTTNRRGAGFRAAPVTVRAGFEARDFQFLFRAEYRFLEGNRQIVLEMRAGLRSASRGCARPHAKKFFKDVGETAKAGEIAETTLRRIVTVAIIELAFFRVGQDLVRLTDFFEFLGGGWIVLIRVGMKLLGEPAKRFFDFVLTRVAAHPENFVIITFSWHADYYSQKSKLRKVKVAVSASSLPSEVIGSRACFVGTRCLRARTLGG